MSKLDTDRKLFREIEEKYSYAHDELSPRFEKFNEYEDLYLGHIDDSSNPWKSKVFDPESFGIIEKLVSHLFASNPRGRFLPREKTDIKGVRIAEELFKYQWNKPGQQMLSKLKRQGRGMGIFGTSFGLLSWRYERRKRRVNKSDGSEGEHYEVVFDDPYYQDLYIYDCFPDPSATCIEDMQWFIHNEYVSLDDLEAQNSKHKGEFRYKNLEELKEKLGKKKKYGAEQDTYRTSADDARGSNKDTHLKDRILIRRYYDRQRWVSIAPDYKIVIEDRPNPYDHGELPIHAMHDHGYTNQLYAIGEIEPILRLQRGLNAVLNQRLDNVHLILSPSIVHDADSEYAHEWKFAPGYKWRKGATENMPELFRIDDVTGQTFMQTTNYFKDAMAKTLGHLDFLTRNDSAGNSKTATEIRSASGEQNARMRSKEQNIDTFMERLATQWMQLNQQFITQTRLIRIVGHEAIEAFSRKAKDWDAEPELITYRGEEVPRFEVSDEGAFGLLAVKRDDIIGAMDFVVEAGSTIASDPEQEIAGLADTIEMLNGLAQPLQQEGVEIHFKPLAEDILRKRNFKNTDEVLAVAKPQSATAQAPEQAMMQEMGGQIPQQGNPLMGGGMNLPMQPNVPTPPNVPNLF